MNWKVLAILPLTAIILSGCTSFLKPEERIITQTEYVEKTVPLASAPKPMSLNDVTWRVVTEENFPEFIEKWEKEHGEPWVFYAISVRSYESMSLNMAELKRYIEQQKAIIVYYENALTNSTSVEQEELDKPE
jgi:hypothetical protein